MNRNNEDFPKSKTLHESLEWPLFTLLHEIKADTAFDLIILNFKFQDGSSSQIVVKEEVIDCLSLY